MDSAKFAVLLVFLALVAACSDSGKPAVGPALDAAAIASNNRAVGMMGQFEYAQAQAVFADLVAQNPGALELKLNLAIATLNRQQEGDEKLALALANEVLQVDPGQLRAHFVAGLMQLYVGRPANALSHFELVSETDPDDAYATYYRAQCLAQQADHEQALRWYVSAMEKDPYLRSAYYGAFQSLQRLGRTEEAAAIAADYQRLDNNPRARLAEFKYTRMGPKSEVLAIDLPRQSTPQQPAGALFQEPTPVAATAAVGLRWRDSFDRRGPGFTTADMQNDGWPDLFLAAVLAGSEGGATRNLVLEGQAGGGYVAATGHPLAAVSDVNTALWGDFDNDGLVDVYLCRRGVNQLWRQAEPGTWENVTTSTRTAGADLDTVDGAFFDADHDGDLDLYLVNADGPNELFNNNLDGSFRPLAAAYGLAGSGAASGLVVPADLDNDRDVDLIVINRETPHQVYLNDRLWSYHPAPGYELFNDRAALAALAVDIDADGLTELFTIADGGELLRWRSGAGGQLEPQGLGIPRALENVRQAHLASHDVNGDGVVDLIVSSSRGWAVIAPGADGFTTLYSAEAESDAPHTASLPYIGTSLAGPAMLVFTAANHGLSLWQPGPGRYPFVTLRLSGKQDHAQSMRSNASGVGAQLAVRVDSRWSLLQSYRNHSSPGQSLQALAVGLKGASRADFISINWSDGVFQSEVDVETGRLQLLTETQRQLSSCPVLFAWNGEEYVFVSDVLGVGGLGYATGPGEYSTPRPWENFLLPEGLLQARGDRFALKITEPMEENAYLDAARLAVYDLPPGWNMVMDERMGISAPPPTGEPLFYRRELPPNRATNDRGKQVLTSVLANDGVAAPVGNLDSRFIGRLQEEHVLTLKFPQSLDSYPGRAVLVIDGWVEYPYSQTNFAAWQAGAGFAAPSLDAAAGDGEWQLLLGEFGYPAGMPRRMALPLPALPPGTDSLRLRTNMQVYWDRITVAFAEPLPTPTKRSLPLRSATLRKTGFAKRSTLDQFRPHYDYAALRPFWDTRYMAGHYTRMGRVDELLATVDDALVIIGPGEEVHLEFDSVAAASPGWRRLFVLEANGWAKDMDLYTRDGETVGPLPTTGKPDAARERLHARYNTRYQAGF